MATSLSKLTSKATFLSIFLPIFLICILSVDTAHSAGGNFQVFDALFYKSKPNLQQYGLKPIKVLYSYDLWAPGESQDQPDLQRLLEITKKLDPQTLTCFDIENWPLTGKATEVSSSIRKFTDVISTTRNAVPGIKLGFYGALPRRDYMRANKSRGQKQYDAWMRENKALKPLAERVDVIFPSLYTLADDRNGWVKYAIENLKEAKKYGKPVYAFLWPMYHVSTPLIGKFLPADFWRLQLETCKKYADGIVIWGGWDDSSTKNDKTMTWDPNASWWLETLSFLGQ